MVTLERQMAPGTDWNRGTRGSIPKCSLREGTPNKQLQTPQTKETASVYREGDVSVTCKCGKVCKNQHGLRIHHGKSGCQRVRSQGQRLAILASETQEYSSLDSTHSTEELSVKETPQDAFRNLEEDEDPLLELLQTQSSPEASQATGPDRTQQDTATRTRKPRIKWPKASDKTSWTQLDEDLDNILEASMQGPVDRKLSTLTTLIYSVGKEREDWTYTAQRYSSVTDDIITESRKQQKKDTGTGKEEGSLHSQPKQEEENNLHVAHSDPNREDVLGDCNRIDPAKQPEKQLNATEPTLGEVKEAVKKARAASAPGPNAIPYKVYKMCPLLLKHLWRLLKEVWRKGDVPEAWKEAEGIFTPKEHNYKTVNQFRTISLLNVEGKIFFAILARRLTSFMTALRHYHVGGHIQKIITSYLDGIKLRFTVGDQLTRWQRLEKGIVIGYTVSVVLFIMRMNLLINAAQRETRGPKTESGIYLPSSRGFMDDLTLTTTTHVQARWMLTALTDNEEIPSIVTSPNKCLGKWFDSSLQDRDNVKKLEQQVEEGLKKIDRCGLPGKFKVWLFQHALLPRLIWP
ncbi:uncharacterized protein LOC127835750 [Dreissena polymorpha]|uniref:uncharacterized protein LOC127835750 n=1 Tax=Dreissena polymorpha TaxID=45954 RepID=UPI0022653754|nr:uncharacterized protein LOC127835750 [Dreissena polymorpha]